VAAFIETGHAAAERRANQRTLLPADDPADSSAGAGDPPIISALFPQDLCPRAA
jgi:hypothetical protein